MKKVLALLLTTVMAISLMTGCGGKEEAATEAPATEAAGEEVAEEAEEAVEATTVADGDTIIVGALYPMTGDMADSGKTMSYGITAAVNSINAAGGINGREIEIVYGDTQGDSAIAMTEMERLITEENVVCVMGCYQSGITATASQVSEQYGVPLLTANATSDNLTANGYEYFFRLAPTNMMMIRDMIDFVKAYNDDKGVGMKTIAICADNSELGQQTVLWTEYWAKENGFEVVETVTYTSGAADLSSEVLALKNANADILVADQYVSDAILLTKTMSEQSYAPKLMICKGNGYSEAAYATAMGTMADGITVCTEFIPGTKGVEISDAFEAEFGEAMNGHSAEAYTVVQVFAEAFKNIEAAGLEINSETVRDELDAIKVEGSFSNGEEIIVPYDVVEFCDLTEINGDEYLHTNLNSKLAIAQFQDGKFVSVYEDGKFTTEFEYPASYGK